VRLPEPGTRFCALHKADAYTASSVKTDTAKTAVGASWITVRDSRYSVAELERPPSDLIHFIHRKIYITPIWNIKLCVPRESYTSYNSKSSSFQSRLLCYRETDHSMCVDCSAGTHAKSPCDNPTAVQNPNMKIQQEADKCTRELQPRLRVPQTPDRHKHDHAKLAESEMND